MKNSTQKCCFRMSYVYVFNLTNRLALENKTFFSFCRALSHFTQHNPSAAEQDRRLSPATKQLTLLANCSQQSAPLGSIRRRSQVTFSTVFLFVSGLPFLCGKEKFSAAFSPVALVRWLWSDGSPPMAFSQ